MPIHCDASGNIFVLPPLAKFSPDGDRTALFDISAATSDGFTDLVAKSFAVDTSGSVYRLARTKEDRVVIVRFDTDGQYSGTVVLDQKFEPLQMGIFKGGAFLVTGSTYAKFNELRVYTPYVGMFDRSGKLIKNIDTNDASKTPPELGIIESDDTDVYILRQGEKPTVFVISPAGVLDRTLTLALPPYPDTQVSSLRVGPGQLLVEYVRPKAMPNGNAAYYMITYGSTHGEKISEYTRGPGVSGILGCTDWRGHFSFVT